MYRKLSHLCGTIAWCLMAVAACVFGTAGTAKAQNNIGLDIRMPKVDKVVVLTASGVNLRKSPSATAPRLMYEEGDMSDFSDYFWSNERKGGNVETLRQDTPLMVVDETDEWYGVVHHDFYAGQRLVYVSKKFAKEVALSPVTPEVLSADYKDVVMSGIYRGYFMERVEGYGDLEIGIGRIVNGMAVRFHKGGATYESSGDGLKRIRFDGFDGTSFPTIKFGNQVSTSDWRPDLTKLTTAEFKQILDKLLSIGNFNDENLIYVNYNGQLELLTGYTLDNPIFKNRLINCPANLPTTPEIANPNDPKPVEPYRISKVNPKCNYAWRGLSVKEVLITHEGTLLKMEFDNRLHHEEWININRQAALSIPGTNIKAKITHKKDIELSPGKTFLGSNEVKTFYLQFEPLPKDTRTFDFHETPTSRWKITGISVQ